MQERPHKEQRTNGTTRTAPEGLARGVDIVLNILLLTAFPMQRLEKTPRLVFMLFNLSLTVTKNILRTAFYRLEVLKS